MTAIVLPPSQIEHYKKVGWIETDQAGNMKFKDDAPMLSGYQIVESLGSIPRKKSQ